MRKIIKNNFISCGKQRAERITILEFRISFENVSKNFENNKSFDSS
jgi:hypothetical protein